MIKFLQSYTKSCKSYEISKFQKWFKICSQTWRVFAEPVTYLLTLFCHKTTDTLVQQYYYQCIKREKSFAVYWIPFKCRENFHGFCFICIESAAIA